MSSEVLFLFLGTAFVESKAIKGEVEIGIISQESTN